VERSLAETIASLAQPRQQRPLREANILPASPFSFQRDDATIQRVSLAASLFRILGVVVSLRFKNHWPAAGEE
jgi:hypothetical protein